MASHVDFVHSKDAQKQLARTSLIEGVRLSAFYLHNYYNGFIIVRVLGKLTSSEDDFAHLV